MTFEIVSLIVNNKGCLSSDPWMIKFKIGSNSETGRPVKLGIVAISFCASCTVDIILFKMKRNSMTYILGSFELGLTHKINSQMFYKSW